MISRIVKAVQDAWNEWVSMDYNMYNKQYDPLAYAFEIQMRFRDRAFTERGKTRQIWGIWKLRPAYSPETPNLGQNQWCFVPCDRV